MRVAIIGAGIVGLATAHALLDRGHEVVLVEPGGKQGRPTDGNAGWIAHTDVMPLASPKAWRNLPRWLMDPLGPLTIRPGYLPHLAPWLARFLLASSPSRIKASIGAIRSIHADGSGPAVAADQVVIAAGIWSRALAAQLGDRIPLDTERGYNATYPKGTFGIGRPMMFEGEGFVTTPLDTGDRVGGAVEFAGLEAAPNHSRTDAMVQRLTRFLPHLQSEPAAKRWMGFRPSIPDSLPVIGPAGRDRRVIYAFGHGHYGLTQAAITSRLVADLVEHKPTG